MTWNLTLLRYSLYSHQGLGFSRSGAGSRQRLTTSFSLVALAERFRFGFGRVVWSACLTSAEDAALDLILLWLVCGRVAGDVPPAAGEVGVHKGAQADVGSGVEVGLNAAGQRRTGIDRDENLAAIEWYSQRRGSSFFFLGSG